MTRTRPNRRGLAIIPALVCLTIVAALAAGMLRMSRTQRGLSADEERKTQADWLAESGLSLASARLSTDPKYRGETWDIPARSFDGRGEGRVKIAVEADGGSRRVTVEAEYPRGDEHRARVTKRYDIDLQNVTETKGGPS
jgi:type II secretory pathway component PulK